MNKIRLGMIALRKRIAGLKDGIKAGDVVVELFEGKAGPPPKDDSDWSRRGTVVGYIVSPEFYKRAVELMKD